jgi:hypothetical protein
MTVFREPSLLFVGVAGVLPSQKEAKDHGKTAFFGRNVSRLSFYISKLNQTKMGIFWQITSWFLS